MKVIPFTYCGYFDLYANTYVLVDDNDNAVIIDPGKEDKALIDFLKESEITPKAILLTHGHFDHIYGLNVLSSIFPSLPIFTNQEGMNELLNDKLNFSRYYGDPFVLDVPESIRLIEDGDCVDLFDGICAEAVFTPGHSPSCVTWLVGDSLFTGDSFIPGVKTVTNVPHSDKVQAAASEVLIHELADHRIVYAGHAPEYEL